jgi:uncharacterized protein YjbJ (UPF0337 family)
MNGTIFRGYIKRFKGSARQRLGRLTGNNLTRVGGTVQKLAGTLQVRYGRIREATGL